MKRWIMIFIIPLLTLSACASEGAAPESIESYIRALAEKDVIAATNGACLAWEEAAFAEASSFEAVEVTLEALLCSEVGAEGEYTLVACEGKIVANYGGELQDIELSQRTYQALFEQGEWKMCGYTSK